MSRRSRRGATWQGMLPRGRLGQTPGVVGSPLTQGHAPPHAFVVPTPIRASRVGCSASLLAQPFVAVLGAGGNPRLRVPLAGDGQLGKVFAETSVQEGQCDQPAGAEDANDGPDYVGPGRIVP